MLKPAIMYQNELESLWNNTYFNEKYYYWHNSNFYEALKIDSDTYNHHQFVSINNDNKIIGFINYTIVRPINAVSNLSIINFSDDKITFAADLKQALRDIFEKYNL